MDELRQPATERNLLACVIKSSEAWLAVADTLTVEDFGFELNAALWLTINSLHEQGAKVDPVLVSEKLPPNHRKELDSLGGWGYLADLGGLPIDPTNAQFEAKKLRHLTLCRRAFEAGNEIQQLAVSKPAEEKLKDQLQTTIDSVVRDSNEEVVLIGEGAADFVMQKMIEPKLVPGLPSGFHELDHSLQGWQAGELYVLGARKKIGKSVCLLNWAKHLAVDEKTPILWITTEHSHSLERTRLLALVSEVPHPAITNGSFASSQVQAERVNDAVNQMQEAPFYFKSLPDFNIEKIGRLVRRFVRLHGAQAVFFDFVKPPQSRTMQTQEWQELGYFAYGLKALATKEEVPILTATQMNRAAAVSFKAGEEIDSDYFAASDRIAQAMTVGMALRPLNKEEEKEFGYASDSGRVLQVTDNRVGPSSYRGLLSFEGSLMRLTEVRRLGF